MATIQYVIAQKAQNKGATLSTYGDKQNIEEKYYKNKTQSLVIGISEYSEKDLRLEYSDDDAILFYDFLVKSEWSKETKLLLNKDATASNIYSEIKNLILTSDSSKPIFIYFSGHGDKIVEADIISDGYLLAWDANNNRVYDGVGGTIEISKLESYIQKLASLNKKKIFLIIDACHAGYDVFKEGALAAYEEFNNKNSLATKFLSCSSNELAFEYERLKQGVFTYYLIKGLSGASDFPIDNIISVNEISKYLKETVSNETSNKQHPNIISNLNNEIVGEISPNIRNILNTDGSSELAYNNIGKSKNISSEPNFVNSTNNILLYKNEILAFNKSLNSINLFDSSVNSYTIFKQLSSINDTTVTIISNNMKNALANKLITESQLVINEILKGKASPPSIKLILKAKQYSDSALALLNNNDFQYQIAVFNSNYFYAYLVYRNRQYLEYDSAFQVCNQLIEIEKNASYVYLLKAYFHDYKNEYDSVIYYANKAITITPQWTLPYNTKGHVYRAKRDFKNALFYYNQALKLDTTFNNSYNNIGNIYYDIGMYNKAEYYYRKSISMSVDSIDASIPFSNLGLTYLNRGDFVKAKAFLSYALKDTNSSIPLSKIGYLYSKGIDGKLAELYYKKALELEPNDPEFLTDLADFYRTSADINKWNKADSLYKKALKINPYQDWAYFGLSYLYIDKFNKKSKADSIIKIGINLNSHKSSFNLLLANYYKNTKKTDSASVIYRSLIKNDSFYIKAYIAYYEFLNSKFNSDTAIQFLYNSVKKFPENPIFYDKIGNYYYSISDFKNALVWFNKLLKIDSSYALVYSSIGIIYLDIFNAKKSKYYIDKAISINPQKYKLADFMIYAFLTSAKIKEPYKRLNYINHIFKYNTNNVEYIEELIKFYYKNDIKDTSFYNDFDKVLFNTKTNKNNISNISYYLCLIAIEKNITKDITKYYKIYKDNTRNSDLYLEIIVEYILNKRNLYTTEAIDLNKYKPANYRANFNKIFSTIIK